MTLELLTINDLKGPSREEAAAADKAADPKLIEALERARAAARQGVEAMWKKGEPTGWGWVKYQEEMDRLHQKLMKLERQRFVSNPKRAFGAAAAFLNQIETGRRAKWSRSSRPAGRP